MINWLLSGDQGRPFLCCMWFAAVGYHPIWLYKNGLSLVLSSSTFIGTAHLHLYTSSVHCLCSKLFVTHLHAKLSQWNHVWQMLTPHWAHGKWKLRINPCLMFEAYWAYRWTAVEWVMLQEWSEIFQVMLLCRESGSPEESIATSIQAN